MSRQLGIGLATIGLAGLLVSTLPGIPMGQSAGAAPVGASAANPMAAPEGPSDASERVGIAGEGGGPSAAPPAASSADSLIGAGSAAAPRPSQPAGIGVYGTNKSAAPVASANHMSYNDASGSSQRAAAVAAPGLADTEPPEPSNTGRGLVMAGSALLLAIGIVLLLIRRHTRRAAWG
jgi:hypothetical protein